MEVIESEESKEEIDAILARFWKNLKNPNATNNGNTEMDVDDEMPVDDQDNIMDDNDTMDNLTYEERW